MMVEPQRRIRQVADCGNPRQGRDYADLVEGCGLPIHAMERGVR